MYRQKASYQDLVQPDAVHGSVYTDPAIFSDELDQIYGNGWVYIGHESEVPNPGDVKRSSIGLQPVILVRDKSTKVHVLFNRCRHRAATVCQFDQDNVERFRCEYHGWTYDLDGSLTHVPYADAYENLDKSALGLSRPRQVDTYRGLVFACVPDTKQSLSDHLGTPAKDQIDLFFDLSPEGEVIVQAGASRLAYDGNWKLQMENSIDGYHPNFTHQSFLKTIAQVTGSRVDTFDGDSATECRALGMGHTHIDYRAYNLQPERKKARLAALTSSSWGKKYYDDMAQAYGQKRAEELIVIGGTHMNVFPNLVILNQQIRTIRPVSPDRTEVDLAPVLLKGVPDELNTQRLRQYEQFYSPQGGGIHDDIEMFNRVADGLRCSMEPWLLFQRGLGRERQLEDGTIAGQVTDEVPQRAMWRHWSKVMANHVE